MSSGISVKLTFPRHPKTLKLVSLAGTYAPWHLILLWIFAGEFYPKGEIPSKVDLEHQAGWKGEKGAFLDAVQSAGFLSEDREKGIYVLHDWRDHNAWIYFKEKRSMAAKRAVEARWEKRLNNHIDNTRRIEGAYTDPYGAYQVSDNKGEPEKQETGTLPAKDLKVLRSKSEPCGDQIFVSSLFDSLIPTLRPRPIVTEAVREMNDEEYLAWVKFVYNRFVDGVDDVAKKKIADWEKAYPKLDVYLELNRACEWLLDNPHNRKSHMFQFYGNWMRNQVSRERTRR
jgi:hypothetical protein